MVSAGTSGGTVIPLLTSRAASLTSIKAPLTVTPTLTSSAPPTGTTINKVTVSSGQEQDFNPSTSVFIHTRQASLTSGAQQTLLPPGSTIYYDPISGSGNVSTGVLSLTTTTVTPVTSQVISASTPGTYTVIPGGATSATVTSSRPFIQIPSTVMTSSNTATPIRFEEKQIAIAMASMNTAVTTTTSTVTQASTISARTVTSLSAPTSALSNTTILHSSVNSAFLRKRDADGSPARVAKNLAPTLLSMSSALPANISSNIITPTIIEHKLAVAAQSGHSTPPPRSPSSDGSTTVSANSSPGIEESNILNEDLIPINRIPNDSHFNPINDVSNIFYCIFI